MITSRIILGLVASIAIAIPLSAGTVDSVKGKVEVNVGGKWTAATVGMEIPKNAKIRTGAKSRAKIKDGAKSYVVSSSKTISLKQLIAKKGKKSNLLARFGTSGRSSGRVAGVAGARASREGEQHSALNTLFSKAVTGPEKDAVDSFQKGIELGNNEEAVQSLQSFLAKNPGAQHAKYGLATYFVENGDFSSSAPLLQEVVSSTPEGVSMPDVYWALMLSLRENGQYEESTSVAKQAIQRYPNKGAIARWFLIQALNMNDMSGEAGAKEMMMLVNQAASSASGSILDRVRSSEMKEDGTMPSLKEVLLSAEKDMVWIDEQSFVFDAGSQLMQERS